MRANVIFSKKKIEPPSSMPLNAVKFDLEYQKSLYNTHQFVTEIFLCYFVDRLLTKFIFRQNI